MQNFTGWVHGDAITARYGATPVGLPTGAGYAAGNRLVDSYLAVVFVPIHDVPATEWALVWRKDALHPRGRGFVEVATELGPREFGTVRR